MCDGYSLGMDEISKDYDNGMKNIWIPRKVEKNKRPIQAKKKCQAS